MDGYLTLTAYASPTTEELETFVHKLLRGWDATDANGYYTISNVFVQQGTLLNPESQFGVFENGLDIGRTTEGLGTSDGLGIDTGLYFTTGRPLAIVTTNSTAAGAPVNDDYFPTEEVYPWHSNSSWAWHNSPTIPDSWDPFDWTNDTDFDHIGVDWSQTFDPVRLSFQFAPNYSGYLSFNVVFGSEEYYDFAQGTGGEFPDTFYIFVTDLDASPNTYTATIISVADINLTNNKALVKGNKYYFDGVNYTEDLDIGPNYEADFYAAYNIGLDGFTIPLRTVPVYFEAGKNYRIDIILADYYDSFWDCAAFFEGGALFLTQQTISIDAYIQETPTYPLNIYYVNKDPTNTAQSALYITDLNDLDNVNWKHIKHVDAIGDYGDNSVKLSWDKTGAFSEWSTMDTKYPQVVGSEEAVRWYNLGHARRMAFMMQWFGNSNIVHDALEVSYNIKDQ